MHQVEITIAKLYANNVSLPNFIKQTLLDLKAQIDPQHNDSGRLQNLTDTNR
jgi:hypothetical protein